MKFYGTQEQFDALTQKNIDEWITKEEYKETLAFGEWLLSHDIVFIDNTEEGNIYDYNGCGLTMKELHQIYLKQDK
ncbi:MAG: hypothetical protein ACOVNU_09920 [Candidatus Kapaibacteriota bacterium]